VSYLYDRAAALARGEVAEPMRRAPLYAEVNLAGDADALVRWHRVTGVLGQSRTPMTIEAGQELAAAATAVSSALQAQRVRIWKRERPKLLTVEEEERIGEATRASSLGS
jgi:hypothetical protein